MPNAKKYKLHSVSEGGSKPLCAFFSSPAGCRQGESCKFSHETNVKKEELQMEHGSVVSSESEPETETKSVADDPFVAPGRTEDAEEPPKKKNRRGKRSDDHLPFSNPKKKAKVESTTVTSPVAPKKMKKPKPTPLTEKSASKERPAKKASFLDLDLPIAAFSLLGTPKEAVVDDILPADKEKPAQKQKSGSEANKNSLSLPTSNPQSRKWIKTVNETRANPAFENQYDFARYRKRDEDNGICGPNGWIKAKSYGEWCAEAPQAIAIDCEMCETQDPVSGKKNFNDLCRLSVVDAVTKKVLLDSLVKPVWPVSDYRTWINGISEEHLENVQFTLRHAQAFMMALCSEETIIVGHAVHNDLAAIRMEHYCVIDSALLLKASDSETATVSLKDAVKSLLQAEMPKVHDSVNDSLMALRCIEHYIEKDGQVRVERSSQSNSSPNGKSFAHYASQLFIHRIPKSVTAEHLTKLFLTHADLHTQSVEPIAFQGDRGKTHVMFRSPDHANLAFQFLEGSKPEPDPSGRLQKKVFLRDKSYIRVRKMAFEKRETSENDKDGDTAVIGGQQKASPL